jgi:hypothetical protein
VWRQPTLLQNILYFHQLVCVLGSAELCIERKLPLHLIAMLTGHGQAPQKIYRIWAKVHRHLRRQPVLHFD